MTRKNLVGVPSFVNGQKNPEYWRRWRKLRKARIVQQTIEYNKNPKNQERKRAWSKSYYKRPEIRECRRNYYNSPEQRKKRMETGRRHDRLLKHEVLAAYGKICHCCGESNEGFLTIGHAANGDGKKHIKMLGIENNRAHLYRALKKLNFPNNPPLYVECYNCNMGKAKNGDICPHKGGV